MLIGICGLIGSGKDTIASHLIKYHGYERYSWATPLKDITATLFGWDRNMLEGTTPEDRLMREQVDMYWSEELNSKEKFGSYWTPRFALQHIGTEVMRNSLHQDIWVLAGMQRIGGKPNVVIPDTRFPNEIAAIKRMGGKIWMVQRGEMPDWYHDLYNWKKHGRGTLTGAHVPYYMTDKWPNVHASEYSWCGTDFDAVIPNNGSIEELGHVLDVMLGTVVGQAQ